jgi:methyl-accepting chemotaxis protein
MSFLSQWRIGRRLGVAFGVVVALTIVSAVFSQVRLVEIQARAHEMTAEQAERTALAYRWRQNVSVNASRAATVALMTDATLAQALLEKIKATSADSGKLQQRFAVVETTPRGRQIQAAIADARQRYLAARDVMYKAGEGGSSIAAAIAKGQSTSAFNAVADEYLGVLDTLVAYETQRAESSGAAR